ncbi:UPF0505 protein C16orf62 [Nymphon striatum]|nr:UPF0505 protein C16orf62 [Nymphon striatum]
MSLEWQWSTRNYVTEKKENKLQAEEVFDHPLKPITVTVKESKVSVRRPRAGSGSTTPLSSPATPLRKGNSNTSFTSLDPLSSALDGMDPLSQLASDPLSQMALAPESKSRTNSEKEFESDSNFEPWSVKKSSILNKYTTSEKLSITTSFLSGGEKVKTQNTVTDKVKHRLEQLDDFEEGSIKEMLDLSQQEYVNRIDELSSAMKEAWDQDQKVKGLKIVIQRASVIVKYNYYYANVTIMHMHVEFYIAKFDRDWVERAANREDWRSRREALAQQWARKLVNDRIHSKAQYIPSGSKTPVSLPDNFDPDQVPESAKETCRNWFFKISSIRELIPRFYVEVAIIKSYSFLSKDAISKALVRLTDMIRGIGDPLIAVYAQCYLCRVGHLVAPNEVIYIKDTFSNFLQTYSQIGSHGPQRLMSEQRLRTPQYLVLYSPALDWILQCLSHQAPESLLIDILDKCKHKVNSTLLLNSIMTAFKPEYVARRALLFVSLMKESDESGFPRHILFRTLGLCLVVADPIEEEKLQILNEVWKVVTKLKNPAKKEVNTFLSDIIKHVTPDRAFEKHYQQLYSIVDKILSHIHDFAILFSMDRFLPFIDLFQKESIKVDVCKMITDAYSRHQQETTNDAVITNAVMFICKVMHDSVSALTVDDEKRQISNLIIAFIRSVSFGRDLEQQLSFYVECRACFTNLEPVIAFLVQSVNTLAMETRKVVKGHHTRKTSSFVKACVAYCYITIPSLTETFTRLQLYLVSGQVALLNQCLAQSDAFFRAAIGLIAEVPKTLEIEGKIRSSEPMILNYINNFLSTLLIVPDHPEEGVLYLIRGLLNVLHNYTWETNNDSLIMAYINVLSLLSASGQESFLYHVEKIDSNDALYGSDLKYLGEIKSICKMLLEQIFAHLKSLGENNHSKRQAQLAFELFNRVIAHGDLHTNHMMSFAKKLWALINSDDHFEKKCSVRAIDYIKRKGNKRNGKIYSDLASKLQS